MFSRLTSSIVGSISIDKFTGSNSSEVESNIANITYFLAVKLKRKLFRDILLCISIITPPHLTDINVFPGPFST